MTAAATKPVAARMHDVEPFTTCGVVEGLASERAMLAEVASGAAAAEVRLWYAGDQALVVPRALAKGRRSARASAVLERLGYPVVARDSGGDVVPQARGVCNVAVAFSAPPPGMTKRPGVSAAYEVLCAPLTWWLRRQGLAAEVGPVAGAFCDGRFNVTIGGRKVAGTAQRWRRTRWGGAAVLAHAAVMVDVDIEELVHVTNVFHRLCGVDRQCEVSSHTTLAGAIAAAGGPATGLETRLRDLRALYRDCLAPAAEATLVTV